MRRALLVLGLLALVLALPAASAESVEGDWTVDEQRCWRIEVDGVAHEVAPVPGLVLHPVDGAEVRVEGELLPLETRCGEAALLVETVHLQSNPPAAAAPAAVAEAAGWSVPLSAALFLVLTLLAVVVTDESVQFQALSAVQRRRSRTEEATFLRGRNVGFLSANQGLHFSAIADHFELGNNQAAHHLAILLKDGPLWKRRDGRRLRFYTAEISQLDQRLPVPLEPPAPDSLPARLLADIEAIEHGAVDGSGQRAIATRLGTSQQLVSHHLRMMEKQGWIHRSGRGRRKLLSLTEHGVEALSESREAQLTNRPSHNL